MTIETTETKVAQNTAMRVADSIVIAIVDSENGNVHTLCLLLLTSFFFACLHY